MGIGSARRAAARAQDKAGALESDRTSTPVRARRANARTPKLGASPLTTPKSSSKKNTGFTSKLPTDEQRRNNGRQSGRNLIIWNRPRMAEKLLLNIHYECSRHKINLPWDEIAHRLHPGSSGQAILQHINRTRKDVAAEGHLVPPVPSRGPGRTQDNKIRGYVRDDDGVGLDELRAVYFDEHLEDRKFGIPGAFVDNYDDVDDVDHAETPDGAFMDTPDRIVKNESPQTPHSPTPNHRKHPAMEAARREAKSSPYYHQRHQAAYERDNVHGDNGGPYYSPAHARDLAPLGPPRDAYFPSQSLSFPHGQCRSIAERDDPFLGSNGLMSYGSTEPAMGMDYGLGAPSNNLVAMPTYQRNDFTFPTRPTVPMGRAETMSSSGTHSQPSSANTSFEEIMKNIAEIPTGTVKPHDLDNGSRSI